MTCSLKEKVIQRIKEKSLDKSEPEIEEAVLRAEEYFLSYTKRKYLPDIAFYLWVDMSVDYLKNCNISENRAVSSIKRGDTTISYAADVNKALGFSKFNEDLNCFRVVIAR